MSEPNHVHVLLTPQAPVPKLPRSLKGITNQLLGLTGRPFWQDESYKHVVRDDKEMERIRTYIEQNPVTVSLVKCARPRSRPGGRLRPRGAAPQDLLT